MNNNNNPIPNTLREKLMGDREQLYTIRQTIFQAINELLSGQATVSYSIQNRSVTRTRADITSMRQALKDVDMQITEIEAMLWGRAVRATTTYSYLAPSNVLWRW